LVAERTNEFDSGLFEAEPEGGGPSHEIKSHNEPRPAYCYLAYGSHRCAPSIVEGNGAYMVNPFGIATTVEFTVEGVENGTGEGTQRKRLAEGVIHPVLVAPMIKTKNNCEPTSYHYTGIATNAFGESTLGPGISGTFGYQCIFS
jgi:hypothetical protein